jgi:hypothetical protein
MQERTPNIHFDGKIKQPKTSLEEKTSYSFRYQEHSLLPVAQPIYQDMKNIMKTSKS